MDRQNRTAAAAVSVAIGAAGSWLGRITVPMIISIGRAWILGAGASVLPECQALLDPGATATRPRSNIPLPEPTLPPLADQ